MNEEYFYNENQIDENQMDEDQINEEYFQSITDQNDSINSQSDFSISSNDEINDSDFLEEDFIITGIINISFDNLLF
jgi:hypothetical protein